MDRFNLPVDYGMEYKYSRIRVESDDDAKNAPWTEFDSVAAAISYAQELCVKNQSTTYVISFNYDINSYGNEHGEDEFLFTFEYDEETGKVYEDE